MKANETALVKANPEIRIIRTRSFFVPGIPKPKGSMRFIAHAGKAIPVRTDSEKRAADFATLVTQIAAEAWHSPPTANAVRVTCIYHFPRPKWHYKRGVLRLGSPILYAGTPDMDKLDRRVHDAMTAIVYYDDKQIVAKGESWKYYSDKPGCYIVIEELEEVS